MKPFGIISDLHLHNWSAFSDQVDGVNSRLCLLIDEICKAAKDLHSKGGDKLFVAGDIFHVRGSVSPTVMNSAKEIFHRINDDLNIDVIAIAGNHDLEGEEGSVLGSAVSSLAPDVLAHSTAPVSYTTNRYQIPENIVTLIPWEKDLERLKKKINAQPRHHMLILHAPIDGVIKGLPENGLDPVWLASLGFKAIFSGHYHNHKEFPGSVYSIGAIAHHSWSDVGSKAGYLLVEPQHPKPVVTWRSSSCPSFVELSPEMSPVDMELAADGNYVKVRVGTSNLAEIAGIRKLLTDAGAKGVIVVPDPDVKTASRSATSIKKGMTLTESLESFVDASAFENKDKLKALCADLLTEAQKVNEE